MDLYLSEFEKLNDYQKEAVTSLERYVLLNASVGSGKTTVLVHKVLYLHFIEKVPLEEMMVLTFTKRATEEMKNRITVFGESLVEGMKYFGTFHSVARLILSESENLTQLGYSKDFEIIDNEAASKILYELIAEHKFKIKYIAKLVKRIEEFKNGRPLYGVMKKNDDIDELLRFYNYEKVKRNVMDFDDIIDNCVEVLRKPLNPKWVIVDEFQDTDYKQLQLIKGIKGEATSIFCIGDPNQIIYSWRSGTENIFNEFKREFKPKEISLPLNYRSTKTIVEAANAFLYDKKIVGTKEYGNRISIIAQHDAFNEAKYIANKIKKLNTEGIPYKDIAILYRRQVQLEILLGVLIKEAVPCNVIIKNNLIDEASEKFSFDAEGVNLLTLHASKGLEFFYVFIIGANMGNIPLSNKKSEEPEELRLFYVGITRAKLYLEISYHINPSLQGSMPYRSPYISMIPKELLLIEGTSEGATIDNLTNEKISSKTKNSISSLMDILREERGKKEKTLSNQGKHEKYGIGTIVFEDEEIIRMEFEVYGTKEFSKVFCQVERL